MAIDTSCFATDLAAVIADLPCAAQFGVTAFNCAATGLEATESLLMTGNDSGNNVRIVFPVTAFTVTSAFKPQARLSLKFPDLTTFTGYEIVSIMKTDDAVSYEVTLKADNRR